MRRRNIVQGVQSESLDFSSENNVTNCVTSPRGLIEMPGSEQVRQMRVRLTNVERDTILAALRRWQSYPAAREADSIATNAGKHKPLDNGEIERICKRLSKIERKRHGAPLFRQSNNGANERKASRTAG